MAKYSTFKYSDEKYGFTITPPLGTEASWTPTGGGNHAGADWILSEAGEVAGVHINVGLFRIEDAVEVTVKPWDGSAFGSLTVYARDIDIDGVLSGLGAGYGGGGGGGGGGGSGTVLAGTGGPNGVGGRSGSDGVAGVSGSVGTGVAGGTGGSGGIGGGTYGGTAGTGGTSGNAGNAGSPGGYLGAGVNGDSSTDESVAIGSGGGGGGAGGGGATVVSPPRTGGGGGGGGASGGAGGASIALIAEGALRIAGVVSTSGASTGEPGSAGTSALVGSVGAEGGSGGDTPTEAQSLLIASATAGGVPGAGAGALGGAGGGGGVLLKCLGSYGVEISGRVSALGGQSSATNGGTVKVFVTASGRYSLTGSVSSGRTYTKTDVLRGRVAA